MKRFALLLFVAALCPLLAALAGESWEVANEAAIRNFRAINKNPGQVAKLSVTCFV